MMAADIFGYNHGKKKRDMLGGGIEQNSDGKWFAVIDLWYSPASQSAFKHVSDPFDTEDAAAAYLETFLRGAATICQSIGKLTPPIEEPVTAAAAGSNPPPDYW